MLHWSGNVTIMVLHMLHTKHNGGNACRCGGIFPQHLVMSGLSTTDQATKASKELIQIMNNPGPKIPFTIWESQLHDIDILATLFNNMQPDKPQKKCYLGKCQVLHLWGCRSRYQRRGCLLQWHNQRWWHLWSQLSHRSTTLKPAEKWTQWKMTNFNIIDIGNQPE